MYVAVCSFEPVDPLCTFSGMSSSSLVDAILLNLQAAGKPGAKKVTAEDFNTLSVPELERVRFTVAVLQYSCNLQASIWHPLESKPASKPQSLQASRMPRSDHLVFL